MNRTETVTLVLAIVGALAWLPTIIQLIANHFRKIQVNMFEYEVLKDSKGRSACDCIEKKGTIIMLLLNFFIKNVDFYPVRVEGTVTLKDGKEYGVDLLDFSSINRVDDDGTAIRYRVPIEYEFNVSRTIKKNTDNIKYMALLVEGVGLIELSDISTIVLDLYSGRNCKKRIKIDKSRIPTFNFAQMIKNSEERILKIDDPELLEYILNKGANKEK